MFLAESFTDTSVFVLRLFQRAERPLQEPVREQSRTCRTGDLRLSEGYSRTKVQKKVSQCRSLIL